MEVYYTVFALVIIFGLIIKIRPIYNLGGFEYTNQYHDCKTQKIIYSFLCFLLFGLVIGLRGVSVGADTKNYILTYYFDVLDNGVFTKNVEGIEILLRIIAWFCQLFTKDYQFFLFLTGMLTSFLFVNYIYHSSNNIAMSCVIFAGMFFVQSLNLMREWLAIGFLLNSYLCLKKGNKCLFIVLFILAFLTHNTAICFIIIPIIEKAKNKKIAFIITIIISILLIAFSSYFFDLLVTIFPKYYGYIYNDFFINESAFNIKDVIYILILIAFLYFMVFKKNYFSNDEYNQYYLYSIVLFVSIIFSLFGQKNYMFHRLVFYYSVFLIVSIPNLIEKMQFKVLVYFVLVIAMFIMLDRNSYSDNNGISNFVWYWQDYNVILRW